MNNDTGEIVPLTQLEFDLLTQDYESVTLPEGNRIVIIPEELFRELKATRNAKRKARDRTHRHGSAKTVRAQRIKRKAKR